MSTATRYNFAHLIENCHVRVARKAHRGGRECGHDIPRGAVYVEYVGETSAFHSGERYCGACAETKLSAT